MERGVLVPGEYESTFSSKLEYTIESGISSVDVVLPTGAGDWILQSQHYIEETSQISWVWKKNEPVLKITDDILSNDFTTLTVDLNGYIRINGKDDDDDDSTGSLNNEKVLIAVRPKSSGLIVPVSFGLLMAGNDYTVGRLCYGGSPTGGQWLDYSQFSEVNRATDATPPAIRTHVATGYADQQKRSFELEVKNGPIVTGSDVLYVVAKSFSGKTNVAAFITWMERQV